MSESTRYVFDSKGYAHYVLDQEYSMSCGPACIAMVESYYKQVCLIGPEKRAQIISQQYPGAFSLEHGTHMENMSHVLNKEGVKAYGVTQVTPDKMFDYFYQFVGDGKKGTSAIISITWAGGNRHAVICRMVYPDQTVVFLDPTFGVIEVKRAELPKYWKAGLLNGRMVFTHK